MLLDQMILEIFQFYFSLVILKKEKFNTSTNEDSNIREVSEVQSVKREEPKVGRNELVKITNGQETKEVKYKKAASLIETGEWKII